VVDANADTFTIATAVGPAFPGGRCVLAKLRAGDFVFRRREWAWRGYIDYWGANSDIDTDSVFDDL
jgi:hypothetical protein